MARGRKNKTTKTELFKGLLQIIRQKSTSERRNGRMVLLKTRS